MRLDARTERWKRDRTLDRWLGRQATGHKDRTLAATDRTQEHSVRSSTERFQSGISATERVRWQATGRWPASDQCFAVSMVGTTGRVWSVAVSWEFDPNGYFLSGAYKYNPNRPFERCGAKKTYQGC